MNKPKPTSRFNLYTLTIVLLLLTLTKVSVFASIEDDDDDNGKTSTVVDDEMSEFEELLEVDEEEERLNQNPDEIKAKLSEAQVLSRAQRIVLELNSDSTKRVIEENEYVLVLGYAPWCVRSAELMPQFAEAANRLKELGNNRVLLGKIDAERYPKVASDLGIKGFPTLLLFVNGTSQVYTGGFTGDEIVIWTQKKTGVPVVRINSKSKAEDFLKNHQTFVVGRFVKFEGPEHDEFVKAATDDNEMQFVEVSDIDSARILYPDIEPSSVFLGIVKSEPEKYTRYDCAEGILEKEKILQFLDYNKFPLVTKLTETNSVRVYSSSVKLQVMVFAETDDFEKLLEPLQNVARKFKSKIMFLYVDIEDENLAKPFLTLYGLEDTKDIVVAAFDSKISSKYLLEADPTPANIEDFSSKLFHGSVLPYYKSQPIPDNKDANVTVVVGKTFDEVVLNSPKNILLEVHTPWCMNCETTSKQVEKLAKHFKDLDNLVVARIDASVNEHPKLQVTDYPALLFYPANDKSKPIKVSTKLSLKDMAKFISKHLKATEHAPKDEL